jgi:hypothetical protein
MSLAAKILAILNVLAAVGFLVIAGLDWSQRQRWAYAVYRHDLFVDGLPIDDKEKDSNAQPRVDKITDATATALGAAGGGGPVKTQQAEVDRVVGQVRSSIGSNDGQGTKRQKLARFLLALARTSRDRDLYAQLAAGQEVVGAPNDEELEKQLNQQLDGAREAGGGHTQTAQERKANAARLLYLLGEALQSDPNTEFMSTPAFKRFVNVVGLTGATLAIEDQANVIQKMTEEVINSFDAERREFVYAHGQIVYNAQNASDNTERQARLLKGKQDDIAKQMQLVDERTVQITKLKEQLAALRQQMDERLADQAKAEQEVMDRLVELRNTAKENLELERRIRELEKASSGR